MSYSPGDRPILARQQRAVRLLAAIIIGTAVVELGLWAGWSFAAAAAPPPPVNLGAAGLTLEVRLQRYTEASGTWTAQDPSAVTVTDRGDGDYDLEGLPTASGTDRYRVAIALAGDPDRALAELTYGALPGSQVLWVPRIDAPEPHRFFEGDSSGTLGLRIRSGLPEAVTDPGTTVTLTLVPGGGGEPLIDAAPASLVAHFQDATTGTFGATLAYALQTGDLPAGSASPRGLPHRAYFTLHFPGPVQRTLPTGGFEVTVAPAPGGLP